MDLNLKKPWLVAIWPGMGAVAQIAGTQLVRLLGAEPIAELDPAGFFEPESISVRAGVVQPVQLARSVFYAWRDPKGERDLVVLLAERQPAARGYAYAQALLEVARTFGVERVVTFAAMASPMHPSAAARVFAAATSDALLADLRRDDVTLLAEAEIGGLNGVFVAAAAERALPAMCLLGEFPFFAAAVPNPKASAAVLRVFSSIAGLDLDLAELEADARKIERGLIHHLKNLQRSLTPMETSGDDSSEAEFEATVPTPEESGPDPIPPDVLEHIEALFAAAREDRSKALQLKSELDRRGLFRRYEDRFLDLFKKAG